MKTLRSFPLAMTAAAALLLGMPMAGQAQTAGAGAAAPAATASVKPAREGWYPKLVNHEQMRQFVDIPPKKGVVLIDSRPAARQYDPGHIPGAINIPDTQFDKMLDRLPADKATKLVFYCGGVECMLSHASAYKAEKLGYTDIVVYADGMPDWKSKGGHVAVSMAHVAKLLADKTPFTLIDARPKRVADKGMIPTAINVSDTEFDKQLDKLPADKAALIIYYCGGLECTLSESSAAKARKLGYTNVMTFPPGYPAWEKAYGAPAAAAAAVTPPPAGAAAVGLVAGKEKGTVTVDSFLAVYKAQPQSMLIVDVRDSKEFANGAMKGATNLPINELEAKIGTLPVDRPVVFVCGTGARSGEAYDMVKLMRGDVNAHFLDADAKFNADGTFTMTAKK